MTEDLVIQPLTEGYLQETVDVALQAFGEESRASADIDFPANFKKMPREYETLIALYNGKVVGCIQCLYAYLDENMYTLRWICVAPHMQQKGIGYKLTQAGIELVKNKFLKEKKGSILLTADLGAETLYKKFDFVEATRSHLNKPLMIKIIEG